MENQMDDLVLPLPEPDYFDTGLERRAPGYTAGRVREAIKQAVEAEREACAEVAMEFRRGAGDPLCAEVAAAIRARSQA